MSQILFTEELVSYIRQLLWDALETALPLKVAQVGDISYYDTTPEELKKIVPGLFIRPDEGVDVALRTSNFLYNIVYRFRIVFVFKYVESDDVVKLKMQKITEIADILFNNTKLTGITTLTNCRVMHCIPTRIEYAPPEDGFLAILGGQLTSGAINLEVSTGSGVA